MGTRKSRCSVGAALMKLVKLVKFSDIWLHLVADLAGGLAAESTFKALNPEDK
jgi:hypothetical protein